MSDYKNDKGLSFLQEIINYTRDWRAIELGVHIYRPSNNIFIRGLISAGRIARGCRKNKVKQGLRRRSARKSLESAIIKTRSTIYERRT